MTAEANKLLVLETFAPKQIRMFEPFTVENRRGQKFQVVCQRHNGVCWRLLIYDSTKQYAGDLLFEPRDAVTVELIDFHVYREFAGNGIGTEVINKLQDLLREQGFLRVIGICKSYDRPLSEKEKLAAWYTNLGFTLFRESMEGEPGYIGRLTRNLKE
ncbi:MAG TPA: GNAT family N-acetyltransferase [Verrucomicrobiae bacterium]|nr:GNAT family N-acetyltransferase [Verrucomicrobiae bacterium]